MVSVTIYVTLGLVFNEAVFLGSVLAFAGADHVLHAEIFVERLLDIKVSQIVEIIQLLLYWELVYCGGSY